MFHGRGALRLALGAASSSILCAGVGGCLDRPIETIEPRTTSTYVDVIQQSRVDKIDLLLVVDNSSSMADKQDVLAVAVPKLVERLLRPACLAEGGKLADPPVATDDEGRCPDGMLPEFEAVRDIHIGIISSSLGTVGNSGLCAGEDDEGRPDSKEGAHLLHRFEADGENLIETYMGLGFLAWDPDAKHLCPGEAPGGEVCAGVSSEQELLTTLRDMVEGVGEIGCGFEATLEAPYRFLADPAPYLDFAEPGVPTGVDEELLAQRAAFLRPDSLVAVVLLTDENDCSFRADTVGSFGADTSRLMPLARSECATDPGNACCKSCIEEAGSCSGDGGCPQPGCADQAVCPENFYPAGDDQNQDNVRCHDTRRRFGLDFLYPTERYVNGFSGLRIDPARLDLLAEEGEGEENPLFADGRPQDLVFVAGIAGVPYELIARKDANGNPDLAAGLDAEGRQVGGFMSHQEMEDAGTWSLLVPTAAADLPDDAHMIESVGPRDRLATTKLGDEIHGNEWDTHGRDLQYACIFDLPQASYKDCNPGEGEAEPAGCDCRVEPMSDAGPADKPLCTDNPDGTVDTYQVKAKAYPGTRVLEVLRGLEDQGVPASIRPRHLAQEVGESEDDPDFGYTPAVFSIIERLKSALNGSCQPKALVTNDDGDVPCLVIEATDSDGDGDRGTTSSCECDETTGRRPITDDTRAAADAAIADFGDDDPYPGFDCLCEVLQVAGKADDPDSDRHHCQNDVTPPADVDGWCYVDASSSNPVGNAELVSQCPPTEQRLVRFVGQGRVPFGGRQYITCVGE